MRVCLCIKLTFNGSVTYNIENKKCDSLKKRRNQQSDLYLGFMAKVSILIANDQDQLDEIQVNLRSEITDPLSIGA